MTDPMVPAQQSFGDARAAANAQGGIIAVGVIALAVGGLATLGSMIGCAMALGIMAGVMAKAPHLTDSTRSSVTAIAFAPFAGYVLGAVSLVWLGIGTLRARRWARALMLVLSWLWLGIGALSTALLTVALVTGRGRTPTAIGVPERAVLGAVAGVFGAFLIGMPLGFILFYGRASVKAAFERLDPVVRWTDLCPLPVLGLGIVLAGVALVLGLLGAGGAPLGGLSGGSASVGYLLLALVVGACAVGSFRLLPSAWWTVSVLAVLASGASLRAAWLSSDRVSLALVAVAAAAGCGFLGLARRWFVAARA